MRLPFKKRDDRALERMFETRSHAWAAVGLQVEVDRKKIRRAWERIAVCVPLVVGVAVGEHEVHKHLGKWVRVGHHTVWQMTWPGVAATVAAAIAILVLGWLLSRDLSRLAPLIFRRMDPGAAGTVGFLIRLAAMLVTILGAFAVAGISLQALALGGAFTAIVLGLAAQQTLGNLFAGMVLLSARPFRVGERIRIQAGALGGVIEGVVSSLGLLYTTLARGEDRILIPNTGVLAAVVVPLREPDTIDVRVRLSSGVRPSQLQEILDTNVSVPTRREPRVLLEEIDGDTFVVRIQATPERHSDGAKLADEVIAALTGITGQHSAA